MPFRLLPAFLALLPVACNAGPSADSDFGFDGVLEDSRCIKVEGPTPCEIKVSFPYSGPLHSKPDRIQLVAQVDYQGHGRNDTGVQQWHVEVNKEYVLPLDEIFIGGTLSIRYKARVRGSWGHWTSEPKKHPLRGNNPTSTQVQQHLQHFESAVVSFAHSGHRMFDDEGLPFYGRGFGLMGLRDPSARKIWHWKEHLDAGRELYLATEVQVANYEDEVIAQGHSVPPLTPTQLEQELFQRMGNGSHYWLPDGNGNWTTAQTTLFADRCITIKTEVLAGNPPNGWELLT